MVKSNKDNHNKTPYSVRLEYRNEERAYKRKRFDVLYNQAKKAVKYEIRHGDGVCRELAREVLKSYNMSSSNLIRQPITPEMMELMGRITKRKMRRNGSEGRATGILESIVKEYGILNFAKGYGINQERILEGNDVTSYISEADETEENERERELSLY